MKIKLPHIKTYTAKGKTYYYHRRTGKRIVGEPGTLAFMQSYEEACQLARVKSQTFNDLICDFFSSEKFNGLAERTKSDYIKQRKPVEEEWGTLPIDVLEDKRIKRHFRKWRDAMVPERGAKQADAIFGLARRIVTFASADGVLSHNHLLDIEAVYKPDRSDIIWLPEHVATFLAGDCSPVFKIALILALNIGRREGDLVKLTWGDYTGDVIHVANSKGGRAIKFPAMVTSGLRAALDAYKASLGFSPLPSRTILTQPRAGTPWPEAQFSNKFSKAKNAAGLTDLHFHDLRGTAVTVLAEEGCTDLQIASITGHSLKQVGAILEKYLARTRALNVAATKKLEETWIAKLAIQ